MDRNGLEMDLPGFRFHPTEEELLDFYLRRVAHGKKVPFDIIATVHLYRHDPWDLPGLARIGEREWYFFVPRDRRQLGGGRPNRTTERGFWKATGSDRAIRSASDPRRLLGLKKTLVFYRGRAPRGAKTDWVMNEYRLPDHPSAPPPKEDIVLCKVYQKATSLKELEQRAAMCGGAPVIATSLLSDQEASISRWTAVDDGGEAKATAAMDGLRREAAAASISTTRSAVGLEELEVPKYGSLEWMQDPFLTQLHSPWAEQWSSYANVLNF